MAETQQDILTKLTSLQTDLSSFLTSLGQFVSDAQQAIADLKAQNSGADLTNLGNAIDSMDAQIKSFPLPSLVPQATAPVDPTPPAAAQ